MIYSKGSFRRRPRAIFPFEITVPLNRWSASDVMALAGGTVAGHFKDLNGSLRWFSQRHNLLHCSSLTITVQDDEFSVRDFDVLRPPPVSDVCTRIHDPCSRPGNDLEGGRALAIADDDTPLHAWYPYLFESGSRMPWKLVGCCTLVVRRGSMVVRCRR